MGFLVTALQHCSSCSSCSAVTLCTTPNGITHHTARTIPLTHPTSARGQGLLLRGTGERVWTVYLYKINLQQRSSSAAPLWHKNKRRHTPHPAHSSPHNLIFGEREGSKG